MPPLKICIVAGEASGDHHAAAVLRSLRQLDPSVEAFGFGGEALREAGMEVLVHIRDLAIVGLFNVIRHIPRYRRWQKELVSRIHSEKPDVVLFVDFPDFNLSTAKKLREMNMPLCYYVSPQVWAWRKGRARKIEKLIDHMMVLFPFEVDCYDPDRIRVTFVGHPIIDRLQRWIPGGIRSHPGRKWRVALLPGSRRMEIESLLPAMVAALSELQQRFDVEGVLIRAGTIDPDLLEDVVPGISSLVRIVRDDGGETLAGCDLAIASSGTVTLEAAVLGVPTIVMYRLPELTYRLAEFLVGLDHYSLVNIVAGREIVPELMQDRATAREVVAQAEVIMREDEYERIGEGLVSVRDKLGDGGAPDRVARILREEAGR